MSPRPGPPAVLLMAGVVAFAATLRPVPTAPSATVQAAATTAATGTASVSSVPVAATVASTSLEVLRTALSASTVGAPASSAAVTAAAVDGVSLLGWQRSSNDAAPSGQEMRTVVTALGDVGADVGSLDAVADAAATTAAASVDRLSANVPLPTGLGVSVELEDLVADVAPTATTATHTLSLPALEVTLAGLAGDLLAALPLDDLRALAGDLGVAVPAEVDALDALATAVGDLDAAVDALAVAGDAVDAATDALALADVLDPLGSHPTLAELQSWEDVLLGLDLLDVAGTLTTVTDLLTDPTLSALCGDPTPTLLNVIDLVPDLLACIDAEQAVVTGLIAALVDEATAVAAATTTYESAATTVLGHTAALDASGTTLADAMTGTATLLGDLGDRSLLSLTGLTLTQEAVAVAGDLDASRSTVTCTDGTLTVAGLPSVVVDACDGAAADVLAAVGSALAEVQDVLDVVGVVGAGPLELSLLDVAEDAVTVDAAGVVTARNRVDLLSLTVPDTVVDPCTLPAGAACALGTDLLDAALDLPALDDAVTAAQGVAEGALAGVSALLEATGVAADVTDAVGLDVQVADAITVLSAQVSGLDTADLGTAGGLTLDGVALVLDPEVAASHVPGAPVPAPDPDPDTAPEPDPDPAPDPTPEPPPATEPQPAPDPTPDDGDPAPRPEAPDPQVAPPTPEQPAPDGPTPQLPATGGGPGLLALLLVGLAALLRGRRRG